GVPKSHRRGTGVDRARIYLSATDVGAGRSRSDSFCREQQAGRQGPETLMLPEQLRNIRRISGTFWTRITRMSYCGFSNSSAMDSTYSCDRSHCWNPSRALFFTFACDVRD